MEALRHTELAGVADAVAGSPTCFSGRASDSLERENSPRRSCLGRARARNAHELPYGVGRLAMARRAPGKEQRTELLAGLALFRISGSGGFVRNRKRLPAVKTNHTPCLLGFGLLLHLSSHPAAEGRFSLAYRKARRRVFTDDSVAAHRSWHRLGRLLSLHQRVLVRSVNIVLTVRLIHIISTDAGARTGTVRLHKSSGRRVT